MAATAGSPRASIHLRPRTPCVVPSASAIEQPKLIKPRGLEQMGCRASRATPKDNDSNAVPHPRW
eukprot:13439133-Alexandrium_andersonii.AAC.1